jgi:hypothetical protein
MIQIYQKLIFLGFIVLLSACKPDNEFSTVSEKNHFASVPGYLSETKLAEDGILMYANRFRNFYICSSTLPSDPSIYTTWDSSTKRITNALQTYTMDSMSTKYGIQTTIKGNFKDSEDTIYYTQPPIDCLDKRKTTIRHV